MQIGSTHIWTFSFSNGEIKKSSLFFARVCYCSFHINYALKTFSIDYFVDVFMTQFRQKMLREMLFDSKFSFFTCFNLSERDNNFPFILQFGGLTCCSVDGFIWSAFESWQEQALKMFRPRSYFTFHVFTMHCTHCISPQKTPCFFAFGHPVCRSQAVVVFPSSISTNWLIVVNICKQHVNTV